MLERQCKSADVAYSFLTMGAGWNWVSLHVREIANVALKVSYTWQAFSFCDEYGLHTHSRRVVCLVEELYGFSCLVRNWSSRNVDFFPSCPVGWNSIFTIFFGFIFSISSYAFALNFASFVKRRVVYNMVLWYSQFLGCLLIPFLLGSQPNRSWR